MVKKFVSKEIIPILISACFILSVGLPGRVFPQDERVSYTEPITIAVIPLEYQGDRRWNRIDVGEQISALITDKLVDKSTEFRLVERAHLHSILREQDLGRTGRVDPSRAVEMGRLLGAQVLVFGTVTQFNLESSGRIGVRGIGVGGTRGRVSLTGRIVDSTTGLILGSVEGSGSGTGASVNVSDVQGVSFEASEFMESAIGRATFSAVDEFVDNITPVIEKNAAELRVATFERIRTGKILQLLPNGAVIDMGAEQGIREQQQLEVVRMIRIEGLEEEVQIPIGLVQIVSVQRTASVATFIDGGDGVEAGDIVLVK